jgi:hypothetical protein
MILAGGPDPPEARDDDEIRRCSGSRRGCNRAEQRKDTWFALE